MLGAAALDCNFLLFGIHKNGSGCSSGTLEAEHTAVTACAGDCGGAAAGPRTGESERGIRSEDGAGAAASELPGRAMLDCESEKLS